MLLENVSDTAIENNFWSADKTALSILQSRLDYSNKSTLSIQNYFKQRAEIEEAYGNQLLKLSQSLVTEECFSIISTTSETTARAHIDLSQNIKNMLEIPLDNYIRDQENIKSFMANQMEESQNMKILHTENSEKARQAYYNECERPGATQEDIDILDVEYKKAVALMEAKLIVWTNEWREACKTFESIELHRLEYLQAVIKTFGSMISCTASVDDQTSERMFNAMDDMNASNELIKFVRTYRTGSAIPDTLKYKKYKGAPAPKKDKVPSDNRVPQIDTGRKIVDIKLPVKNDEQLRSVNEQLKKIPNANSPNESNIPSLSTPYPSEIDKMSDSNKQYPLHPIYKMNKKSPSQSDPALSSWCTNQGIKKEEPIYNTKSALIIPQERHAYIQNNHLNRENPKYSPPSPNSPTRKQSTLMPSFGFLKKKKKSVTEVPQHEERNMNTKRLSIIHAKFDPEMLHFNTSKPLPDLHLHESQVSGLPPPSPLFSPIDFYYSPANDIGKQDAPKVERGIEPHS